MLVGAILFGTLAAAGVGYTLVAVWVVARFGWRDGPIGVAEPVTLLKPLHGAEPRLAENLATFLDQEWDAPIEMIAGVQRADDPAREALKYFRHSRESGNPGPYSPQVVSSAALDPRFRGDDERGVVEVVDPTRHGANAKIANLINMAPHARHDLLVLSDSDMAVPPTYLATLAGALARPNVGAVTCLYRGRGDAGAWSTLAAAQISYQFLPSVLVGLRFGIARPCMGSTIALRRPTLTAIGGFQRFTDDLADDYAIGAAIRAIGLQVAVPPMILTHACTERSLADLWQHELRWQATVRGVDPVGVAGSIVTYPIPLALIATCFSPRTGLALLIAAMLSRLILKLQIDRAAEAVTATLWQLPLRDCLSFATYVAGFFVRSVDWRGATLKMISRGRIAAGAQNGFSGQAE
jgi:ceramide glucosyltransferase